VTFTAGRNTGKGGPSVDKTTEVEVLEVEGPSVGVAVVGTDSRGTAIEGHGYETVSENVGGGLREQACDGGAVHAEGDD